MQVRIRQENSEDHPVVFGIIKRAFQKEEMSDHKEQFLVENLRQRKDFIPELSLVAVNDDQVIGHILLTEVKIQNSNFIHKALALAPVSVHPEFQGMGIGAKLIKAAHEVARNLKFGAVVLLGHSEYYPRFGYKKAEDFNIKFPFEAPSENCMVKELRHGELNKINGTVLYPKEFYV